MPDKGKFRIQNVAELTGVTPATLRAWERRYGFPSPERTESSYRLYSDRDVELIHRVRQLCDQGMSAGQAARAVLEEATTAGAAPASTPDPFASVKDSILDAIAAFEPERLEEAVRGAMILGSPETTFDRIFAPVLKEIGDRWEAGEVSIAQEHVATEVLSNAVRDMLRLAAPRSLQRRAVVACVAEEDHHLALYGLAFRLSAWGISSVILGARTPPSAIREAVTATKPGLVALSATVPIPAYRARELFEDYAAACGDTPWIIGGSAVEAHRSTIDRLGGAIAEREPRGLRSQIEALLRP